MNQATTMRALLASNGIFLDEKPSSAPPPPIAPSEAAIDRDVIREILVDRGAPANDLDWLVASCISVEAAREYVPPPKYAWCVDCGQGEWIDADGCMGCRARQAGGKGPTT